MKMQKPKEENSSEELKFEKAIEKLEKIVEFLEGGEAPLDEALKKYEEGVHLARLCGEKLAQAEKRVEILSRQLDGSLKPLPFEVDAVEPEEPARTERKERRSKPSEGQEGLLL